MRFLRFEVMLAPFLFALGVTPVAASVHDVSASGFAVRQTAIVPASPETVWNEVLDPAEWWDGEHTFSGDAANLSIDPRAGGCFCELLPNAEDKQGLPRGGVQHLQVVYLEKPRVLRMTGALGPLQSEAVIGTMTFILKADEGGTRINVEYVVGGYLRIPAAKMAPLVDRVIGGQISRLAVKLGGEPIAAASAAPSDDAASAPENEPAGDRPPAGRAPTTSSPKKAPIIGR